MDAYSISSTVEVTIMERCSQNTFSGWYPIQYIPSDWSNASLVLLEDPDGRFSGLVSGFVYIYIYFCL